MGVESDALGSRQYVNISRVDPVVQFLNIR